MKMPVNIPSAPSRTEMITLRLMILLGVGSIVYLLYCLFRHSQIGFPPFYWILMFAISFNCLRTLHEWYHYFSISIPQAPPAETAFSVDIFTTYCPGEPLEMVVNTLRAIQQIHYPHTAWLCDEADDPYLKEVCLQLGVRHVTRNDRRDAKAGNINNALQFATGDLCVVLDPDHVPGPDFLDPIVPHFNDPGIGFVQIVQAYSNLDVTFIAKGAAQQTFQFYGPIMMTMNSYGTVLAIGANCTFRRAALDSIGGHAAGLAEDMHTAMQLHAKGWKSVYVPAVLARGLVPSTLSAYYAQQLKWSRGTFELFVTSFPRLFRKFTWRQKIHYACIPLYYFSGIISLINFVIPVLSLCTGWIPFRVDMIDFLFFGMPMIASIILIRHFVQRWVMEEKERGFHVVGGLLQIGTWWIYITGLVYTLIRKKVPYIPTPKDGRTKAHWTLSLPNILMAVISLAAIVYGLSYDWNPYALVMAGIAGVNFLILSFNILISQQSDAPRLRDRYDWIRKGLIFPLALKKKFWLFRHKLVYTGFRKLGLPLLLITVFTAWYARKVDSRVPSSAIVPLPARQEVFYTGIYTPGNTEGLVSMKELNDYQRQYDRHFNIISVYIPWGESSQCFLTDSLADVIYGNNSIPMITWEPWMTLFEASASAGLKNEQKVFARILDGYFDHYLERFCGQIRALNRPVFLRFAHEPDNPAYPWSTKGNNSPAEFRAAWRYVYEYFLRSGVSNIIWVWSPWHADAAAEYFPGKEYVDWISVTGLNYGSQVSDGAFFSFSDLYRPFHRLDIFQSGLPVMIGEMGSLQQDGRQTEWFDQAFADISTEFKEVRAVVLFNNSHDRNVPRPDKDSMLNWQPASPDTLFGLFRKYPQIDSASRLTAHAGPILQQASGRPVIQLAERHPVSGIRGINYHKGENWFRNFHQLTRRDIANDFREMQAIGINTIKRFGPGVYDRNILATAGELHMQVNYAFWLPDIDDMGKDQDKLASMEKIILNRISELKEEKCITAWSLGNPAWERLAKLYDKPVLLYQQGAYEQWLSRLAEKIRTIDPDRPLTVDVKLTGHMDATLARLRSLLPRVDAFGLVAGKDTTGLSQLAGIQEPFYISEISAWQYLNATKANLPVFIRDWQDQERRDYISFDGLIDHWGRYKKAYYTLRNGWSKPAEGHSLPALKILRPAKTTFAGTRLRYYVLTEQDGEWRFPAAETDLRFEWHLIKTDLAGNAIYMRSAGSGSSIDLAIPEQPELHRLYVQAIKGNDVIGVQSVLNLPLGKDSLNQR